MESATTGNGYEYYNYNDTDGVLVSPCNSDKVNSLGAKMSIIYYFMFLFSVFVNGLVLVIIHRFERLTTVTNIFLLNLVVSSLIFISSLPFLGVYMQVSNWIFGNVMCKIVGSVYYLGFYSSVLFLTLLTFDRHLAVVYSLGAPRVRNQRYALLCCVAVWLISSLACIPPMILRNRYFHFLDNKTYCEEYSGHLDSIYTGQLKAARFYIQLFLFWLFPLIIIVYCYIRIAITVISSSIVTKFKTVRLIFVIVMLFFICWTPFSVVLMIQDEAKDCEGQHRMGYALQITQNIAYIYFCISPIFYTFVGRKFQNYARQLLVNRFPGLKKHISVNGFSRASMSTKSTQNEL